MRKKAMVLAAGLTLAVAQPATAQVKVGLRAGASLSDISFDAAGTVEDLERSTGLLAGAFLEFPLAGGLSLQPGVHYVRKGAEQSSDEGTVGIELSYAEVPVLLKYAFPTAGPVGAHLYGGPAVAFETSCKLAIESDEFDAKVDCDEGGDPDDEILTKSVDVGAMFGGGLAFGMGNATLMIDGFYNLGLTNIADNPDGDDGTAKNRAFYVTAAVAFPLGL